MGNRMTSRPRPSRIILTIICVIFISAFLYSTREIITETQPELVDQHVVKQSGGIYRLQDGPPPSVSLVIAATSSEDISWVKELKVPGMQIIPYIADDLKAPHHAQKNKGHEAMMYHQYFYDYYDDLPDISILIHSQQTSWHVESLLDTSMVFSLNHMDMREVQRRRFLNLRVTWGLGCSSGQINTTKVNEESMWAPEVPEMQDAFRANFNIYEIPEILATSCCSQIAVVKELIRKNPREQYKHHIQWLLDTRLPDNISGRTWEHMWQWLFLEKAIDCPIEHRAYCRLYHICFGGRENYDEWIELNQGRQKLQEELQKLGSGLRTRNTGPGPHQKFEAPIQDHDAEGDGDLMLGGLERNKQATERARINAKADVKKLSWLQDELATVEDAIRVRREVAIVRGAVEANRIAEGEDIYGDLLELGLDILTTVSSSATATATLTR